MQIPNTHENQNAIELPIDGVIDLHTFHPRDVKELLPCWLQACKEKGIFNVRIIHGKGSGALRNTVHSILSRSPEVDSFKQASEDGGGWGAMLVVIKKIPQ